MHDVVHHVIGLIFIVAIDRLHAFLIHVMTCYDIHTAVVTAVIDVVVVGALVASSMSALVSCMMSCIMSLV